MSQRYLFMTNKLLTKFPPRLYLALRKVIKRVFKCHAVSADSIGCRKNAESRAECGIVAQTSRANPNPNRATDAAVTVFSGERRRRQLRRKHK